jgi:hypothetical protein
LQVEQHADRPPRLALDAADAIEPLSVLLLCAVAEVQAEDIGADIEHRADDGRLGARGPQRGDNLGMAQAAHGRSQRGAHRRRALRVIGGENHKPRAPEARKPPSTGMEMPVT